MAFKLMDFLGSNLGSMVKEIIGSFKLDPELKAKLADEVDKREHELMMKQADLESKIEDHLAQEVKSRADIIVSEMQQDDKFTKRARPAVVYAGLVFIFMNHVLPAMLIYFGKEPTPIIALPDGFWGAWELVLSVWAVGRTAEKLGAKGGLVSAITGSRTK